MRLQNLFTPIRPSPLRHPAPTRLILVPGQTRNRLRDSFSRVRVLAFHADGRAAGPLGFVLQNDKRGSAKQSGMLDPADLNTLTLFRFVSKVPYCSVHTWVAEVDGGSNQRCLQDYITGHMTFYMFFVLTTSCKLLHLLK